MLASCKQVGYIKTMLGRTYDREICSAARALEIAGERWSLLILRNAMFAGMTRFTEFQDSLGIAPNVLASRLKHFVETGIMETSGEGGDGHEAYLLTPKGLDFKPVIVALTEWGDRWAAPEGPPIVCEHDGCGGRVSLTLSCAKCGERPELGDVAARKTAVMERLRAGRKG
ncbi:MAG: winged helix-turn-helix transcriptional regulator [Gemmatimonadota bacterium]